MIYCVHGEFNVIAIFESSRGNRIVHLFFDFGCNCQIECIVDTVAVNVVVVERPVECENGYFGRVGARYGVYIPLFANLEWIPIYRITLPVVVGINYIAIFFVLDAPMGE